MAKSLQHNLRQISVLDEDFQIDDIRKAFDICKARSPFVREIVEGNTTFTEAIQALYDENVGLTYRTYRQGSCRSPDYQKRAEEVKQKFQFVLDLQIIGSADLTNSVRFVKLSTLFHFVFYLCLALCSITGVFVVWGLKLWGLHYPRVYLYWLVTTGVVSGLILALLTLFIDRCFIWPSIRSKRRNLAEAVYSEANFLDEMLARYKGKLAGSTIAVE